MSANQSQAFRFNIAVFLVFAGFTALLTYPQVLFLGTSVPYHSDPYFSMWRLGWVAHAIIRDPRHLFDANIFYPERSTLGYSDAMLLPGVLLAPLFWARINPVAIYNGALFAALALSGFTMFVLARRLTGDITAGLIAGLIYGFAPYRFAHYMHLELQLVFWLPLGLLLIHRIVTDGRVRDGVWLGVVVTAQALSSVYAAMFFVTYCAVFAPLLIAVTPAPRYRRIMLAFAVAAGVTLAVVTPYARAYARASQVVGTRSVEDVRRYSASLTHFLAAPSINRLYGWTAVTDPVYVDEMNLFPGAAAMVLGAIAVFAARGRIRLVYLAALVFAFDLSRGVNGAIYPLLFQHVQPFRGLRSPARMDILVNLSLAVLCAYGAAWLLMRVRRPIWRVAAGTTLCVVLMTEYASTPELTAAPKPSKVDSWLAGQPPVVIVELPLSSPDTGWSSRDWLYMYLGMKHRQRMLNGYSGFAPASYYAMLDTMQSFPDDRSMTYLRDRRVDYVILRGGMYPAEEWPVLIERVRARRDLSFIAMFSAQTLPEAVFAVRK